MASEKGTILLLGGTGKVSSRIAPLLSENGNSVLLASRSGNAPSLPNCGGVKFDWFDQTTHANIFTTKISAIFLVGPPIVNQLPLIKPFLALAISKGVKRIIFLSGSCFAVGDGPMMGEVSGYIASLSIEYAILRPTWFMENLSEMAHRTTICEGDKIVTAAGDGKVPFVSAGDIAAVAFRVLTDEVLRGNDYLIVGSELFTYDEVATMISKYLGRKITHERISEDEAAKIMSSWGIPDDYARLLAELDTYIAGGNEEVHQNDLVFEVTGKQPVKLEDFIKECVAKGVWAKK